MIVGYYYADSNRQPVGPLSADEVMRLCREGRLKGDSPLFVEGGTTWATVDTLLRPPTGLPNAYTLPLAAGCRSCGATLAPGARWCAICHASAIPGVTGTLATPARRLAAYVIDFFMPLLLIGALAGLAFVMNSGVLVALLSVAYIGWSLVLFSRGTTPGKHMLGMDVIDENGHLAGFGKMFVREWIGKLIISHMVFGLGLVWILIDKDRQCWHDKLVNTYVVKRPDMV
jgi:uncharacterized RDD family membrane protein YckC